MKKIIVSILLVIVIVIVGAFILYEDSYDAKEEDNV